MHSVVIPNQSISDGVNGKIFHYFTSSFFMLIIFKLGRLKILIFLKHLIK